jgi:ABC-type transport system substrate-binding protein
MQFLRGRRSFGRNNEFLSFNHRQEQLKDKRVRQTVAYAIDRNAIT